MTLLEVTLPGLILFLAFVLKLVVDRTAGIPELIAAILELPVDVAFLATTLIAAFTLATKSPAENGLIDFVFYIVGSILVVVLWRRSARCFLAEQHLLTAGLSVPSYALSAYGLVHAVGLISGVAK